jgi:hypothetical protein
VFELGQWYGLIDADRQYQDKALAKVFCGATVDNAANEINAAGERMGVLTVPDAPHTLALIVRGGIKRSVKKARWAHAQLHPAAVTMSIGLELFRLHSSSSS